MATLTKQLDSLPQAFKNFLQSLGFDFTQCEAWSRRIHQPALHSNRVQGAVTPIDASRITEHSQLTHELYQCGLDAIMNQRVAFVLLAGGMATRMGGVVKALVDVMPHTTFLDYRFREIEVLQQKYKGKIPIWLMTSFATHQAIQAAINSAPPSLTVATFMQNVSLRFTSSGDLFLNSSGEPSLYSTGHGDVPDALKKSGLLDSFLAQGGQTLWVANIDNLGATIDPALLGWHRMHGAAVSVELVDKIGSDRGGIPADWNHRPVILEEFRLPTSFDANQVRMFNTNTFLIDAQALKSVQEPWTYFEVRKQVDGQEAIQFERLLGELTSMLDTQFVRVPRTGVDTRFLPVKDGAELEARRAEIEAIARARGIF